MERLAASGRIADPLFATPEDRENSSPRHSLDVIPKASLDEAEGHCWLGIDIADDDQGRRHRLPGPHRLRTTTPPNEGDPVARGRRHRARCA